MGCPSFQLRTTGRRGEIECREAAGRVLRIPWEMSGSPEYDLLLAPLNLSCWSSSADASIPPPKQRGILAALRHWLRSRNLRTDIDLPEDGRSAEARCSRHLQKTTPQLSWTLVRLMPNRFTGTTA